ncbi:MAG: TetR/AcrR family transcriptional regulator [Negativicutes bacterium]|nr:TetR/AcrR family transcriptional regulator [Negativicutes bacterium]
MTKGNIIIAALRLFVLRGYKYVSLIDVANEVGVTKGGIYHYFSSKEELLWVATQHLFDRLEEKHNQLSRDSKNFKDYLSAILVEQQVEHYIDDTLGIKGDLRANFARLFLETIDNYPEIQNRLDRSRIAVCCAIEQRLKLAEDSGEIRNDLDTDIIAAIIFSILQGQRCSGICANSPNIRQQIMDNLWKLIGKTAI